MKLVWDEDGKKFYEYGVDHGVLYVKEENEYPQGVVWNGLTNVTESPEGAEPTDLWADNIKYGTMMSAEKLNISISAYTYPDEFMECDGAVEVIPGATVQQQNRKTFGISYRTAISDGNKEGYKLHLVWGCLASPSEKSRDTVNDSPEALTFSWEASTTPVTVTQKIGGAELKPTASMEFNSLTIASEKLAALETILYGDESTEARLPLPDEVIETLTAAEE